ncbi:MULTISPECIES: hypothetical protein [Streptomyces]|uniref:hypothetical protein n=1 Tax=Streptomyces TaxID=1883 RepID=UPI0013B8C9E6|nr:MULTISPECIES: hypothetical protein [Streptomyces]NEC71766.1 hypothetical protein [Streptomyces rochei]
MNGDPLYYWISVAVSTALLLPISTAILAGWTAPWLRKRQAGMRFRAYGALCCYALTLLNALPQATDASHNAVVACANVGFAFIATAAALFLLAKRKDKGAAREADVIDPARCKNPRETSAGPTAR